MNIPQVHTANNIRNSTTETQNGKGKWVPARPMPYTGNVFENTRTRCRLAFLVLIGKYDALNWEN